MKNLLSRVNHSIHSFTNEEDGAQVVEYALIIAVVSIALVVALKALTTAGGGFTTFISNVKDCLIGATCNAPAP
jgi:pilus assembly protein Flp/PilA